MARRSALQSRFRRTEPTRGGRLHPPEIRELLQERSAEYLGFGDRERHRYDAGDYTIRLRRNSPALTQRPHDFFSCRRNDAIPHRADRQSSQKPGIYATAPPAMIE